MPRRHLSGELPPGDDDNAAGSSADVVDAASGDSPLTGGGDGIIAEAVDAGSSADSPSQDRSPAPVRSADSVDDAPFAVADDIDDDDDGTSMQPSATGGSGYRRSVRGESVPPSASSTSGAQLTLSVRKGDGATADPEQLLEQEAVAHAAAAAAAALTSAEADASRQQSENADATRAAAAGEKQWRQRAKHVFILSSAGKPIFTRYGDESDFSELFGILQVLVSMAASTGGGADALRRVASSSGHAIYFHQAGEVLFTMVTRTGESPKACMRQLRLLSNQLMSVLPTVNAVLTRNPGFDVRRMFSHGDINVMQSLIKRLSNDLPYHMRALHPVALPPDYRTDVDAILRSGYGGEDHLYSFLLYRGKIVGLVCPPKQPLHPDDVLLLINFTHCIATTQGGEVWAPICLPRFNDSGYLWCYTTNVSVAARQRSAAQAPIVGRVSTTSARGEAPTSPTQQPQPTGSSAEGRSKGALTGGDGMLLVQLATSQEAFPDLSATGNEIIAQLIERDLVREIETVAEHGTLLPIDDQVVGRAEDVLFFMFVADSTSQMVTTDLPPQLKLSKSARKDLFRLLVRLRDKLLQISKASAPLLVHNTEQYNILVEKAAGGEAFIVCLPGTPKKQMMACCSAALKWIKAKESTLMISKTVHWPQ